MPLDDHTLKLSMNTWLLAGDADRNGIQRASSGIISERQVAIGLFVDIVLHCRV